MVKKLIIAIGDYGTGKTSFAEWYAQDNDGLFLDGELLIFDGLKDGTDRFDIFVERLISTIPGSPKHLFVIDGYKGITSGYKRLQDPTFAYLRDKLNCDIQLCLCFAAPHIVQKRQMAKKGHVSDPLPREESEIERITYSLYSLAISSGSDSLFVDTTDGFHFVDRDAWPQRWQELLFLSELDKRQHDKYYQDIDLPSGLVISGYSQSRETWVRLCQLIDFKGKEVLDIGCFHGFICFKAEESGAEKIHGLELNQDAIETARQVAWLRKSSVRFYQGDVVTFKADQVYDIVLALNMLHHVSDLGLALENLFRTGRQVVFEIPVTQEAAVIECADRFGFQLLGKTNSHRDDREIIIFTNPEANIPPLEIPPLYQYNYQKERKKLLVRNAVTRASRVKIFFPLVWIVRQYRRIRKTNVRHLVKYQDK